VVEAGETRVTVVGTHFTVRREGVRASVSVREGHVQVDSGATHVRLGPGEDWPDQEQAAPPAAPTDEVRKNKRASRPSAQSAQRRFERAAGLEASDPAASAKLYEELARGRGPWAANALYARARLELERGHPERAKPLFERYLVRYPRGRNAADVRAQLQRLATE
jgi:hypothetical protein